jgi:hypothetical protein
VPERTPRRSSRAPPAAIPIRPGGLNSTSQASASAHQGTVGAHGTATAATVEMAAVTLAQRRPTSPSIGTISSACATAARRGVGTTSRRRDVDAPNLSSRAASAPSLGWTYRSFTDTWGWRVRMRATSCAAVRLPPPWVKKSAFGSVTDTPRISAQPSASQPSVGVSRPAAAGSRPPAGRGQGSASRSTLPDVRVGTSSTTASSGTSAAGSRSCSAVAAASVSSSCSATT